MDERANVHSILVKRLKPFFQHESRHGHGAQQIGKKQIRQ